MIGANERWTPGIGDPTPLGWATVVCYAVAFFLCIACLHADVHSRTSRRFWAMTSAIVAFLGINKQLDLQTWLTQTGRDLALQHGWYEERQVVQLTFIAALVAAALLALIVLHAA